MAGIYEIPEGRNIESSSLCYIENDGCYLMMHRVVKENDINHDKWIGVGGHFEEGENSDECLVREVKEETGIIISDYRYRGLITFIPYEGNVELMHLYTATLKDADMTQSIIKSLKSGHDAPAGNKSEDDSASVRMDEGILEWVPKDEIWDLELWEGDRIFLKILLEGKDFKEMLLAYDENGRLCEAMLEGVPLI